MSLQSIAQPDIAKVHAMLSKMDGPQLQKFAAANQDNAIYVSLAMQVDKDRKEQMQRLQALMTGQKQPDVMQQVVAALNPQGMAPPGMGGQGGAPMPPPGGPQAPMPPQGMPMGMPPPGMQMPPPMPPAPQMPPPSGPSAAPQGLAGLPAPNMQGMADGGIAGYADEDEAVGYADGGAIRMAGGGFNEDAIRKQLISLGTPQQLIEIAVQRERMAAENAQQSTPVQYIPAQTGAVAKDNMVVRDTTSMFRDPGYDVFKNPPTIRQLYGDPVNPEATSPFGEMLKSTGQSIGRGLTGIGRGVQSAVQSMRDVGDPLKNPRELEARRLEKAAAVEPGYFEALTPTERAQREAEAANIRSVAPLSNYSNEGYGRGRVQAPANQAGAPTAPAAPTQTYADLYKAVGAGNVPAASRGAGLASLVRAGGPPTLTPPNPLTAEKAMENVGQFFDPTALYAQADRAKAEALGRAEETAQFVKFNKPAAPFKKLAEKLDTEEFNEVSEKEKAKGMALMMAGLKMMESPYGGKGLGSFLRNVGAGATEGAKELQKSNKEFKELAQKRMQMRVTIEAAQDAAARGDFDREIALRTRADQIEDSANNNRMRIGEALFNAKGTAALTAFNHAENVANQFKLTEFGAQSEAYNNERRIAAQAANTQAQIAAQRQSDLFKAQLPPESLRAAAILGGARPGETGTPEQIKAGLTLINSEKFNPQTAYSKYVTDWKKDQTNPNDRMMTYPEYLAMFGAGKVTDTLPANALVRKQPQ
jgi:hypothetical protein